MDTRVCKETWTREFVSRHKHEAFKETCTRRVCKETWTRGFCRETWTRGLVRRHGHVRFVRRHGQVGVYGYGHVGILGDMDT